MTFTLAIYTQHSSTNAAILRRKRMPGTYPTASDAAAAGVAHLKAHAKAVGFEVEPQGLDEANADAIHSQRIMRARAMRGVLRAPACGPHCHGGNDPFSPKNRDH